MIDRRLAGLLAVPSVLVAVIVAAVAAVIGAPIWAALGLGVVVGALVAVVLHRLSATRALASLDAEPLADGAQPRLENLLDAICVNNGFDRPAVWRVNSAARNSAVFASTDGATIVITDGLLAALDHMGTEALLAHQLAVTTDDELEYHTRMAGLLSLLPDLLAARLGDRLLDRTGVFEADIAGARVTRYPPGQVSLLEALASGDNRVGGVSRLSADLWLVNPLGRHDADASHPPVDDRIAVLREL